MAVVVAIALDASMPVLVAMAVAGNTTFNLANLASLTAAAKRKRFASSDGSSEYPVKRVLVATAPFLVFTVLDITFLHSDNLIIIYVLSSEAVAQNAVALRIYSLPLGVTAMFYAGIWAAYSNAEKQGEHGWIRRTYWRTTVVGILFTTAASTALVLLMGPLSWLLTGGQIDFDPWLVAGYWIYPVLASIGAAQSAIILGLNLLRLKLAILLASIMIKLPLSYLLASQFGTAGPVWATVATITLTAPVAAIFFLRHVRRRERMEQSP